MTPAQTFAAVSKFASLALLIRQQIRYVDDGDLLVTAQISQDTYDAIAALPLAWSESKPSVIIDMMYGVPMVVNDSCQPGTISLVIEVRPFIPDRES